jgi:Tol biopolymer transport system component
MKRWLAGAPWCGLGMTRLAIGTLACSLGLVSVVVTDAHATPPGRDGGRIAFSTDQSRHPQIFSVRVDGTGIRQLTHVPAGYSASSPDWSPDGTQILFNSDVSGEQEIWVMNADGSNQHRLLVDPRFFDQQARWSADGNMIVFSRCAQPFGFPDYCDIDLMNTDGSGVRKIIGGRWVNQQPEFSPDGQQLVFDSNRGGNLVAVWRANIDGSDPTRLTPPLMEAFYADWSPDGEHILFTDNNDRPHSNVWEMRTDGTDLTQITHSVGESNDAFATYAPNGRKIVFVTDRSYPDCCGNDIYVMNHDGSDQTPVVTTVPGAFFSDWSPKAEG